MADIKKPEEKKDEKKEEKSAPRDNIVESKHSITIGGKVIKYTVTTGTMVMKEEVNDKEKDAEIEKPRAQIFFIAYTRDGVKDKGKRPVTFSFQALRPCGCTWVYSAHAASYLPKMAKCLRRRSS